MRLLKMFGLFLFFYFSIILLVTVILTNPFSSRISKFQVESLHHPNSMIFGPRKDYGRWTSSDRLSNPKLSQETDESLEMVEESDERLEALYHHSEQAREMINVETSQQSNAASERAVCQLGTESPGVLF